MGYHVREIEKGTVGEFSKIREEFMELADAVEQDAAVLQICELTDLVGAIEAYSLKRWNLNIVDLMQMANMTKQAFLEGKR